MDINLTTPSLLFPTVSLLLLAYTNRFVTLAAVIRQLHASHLASPNPVYLKQIANLSLRIRLIRDMQFCGVLSMLLCTICMSLLFCDLHQAGKVAFGASLVCMVVSLIFSLIEIRMSVRALDLHLEDIEKTEP
jgi:hypothetical protein